MGEWTWDSQYQSQEYFNFITGLVPHLSSKFLCFLCFGSGAAMNQHNAFLFFVCLLVFPRGLSLLSEYQDREMSKHSSLRYPEDFSLMLNLTPTSIVLDPLLILSCVLSKHSCLLLINTFHWKYLSFVGLYSAKLVTIPTATFFLHDLWLRFAGNFDIANYETLMFLFLLLPVPGSYRQNMKDKL